MLTVISPAKRLDWDPVDMSWATEPEFQSDAVALAKVARKLKSDDLRKLMGISESLADLNVARFKAFQAEPGDDLLKPAALAFGGDTYVGLEAATLTEDDMVFGQDHLRILSGLYGLLRPLDKIQPYRLEMGSKLQTKNGASLYAYWGPRLAKALNAQASEIGTDTLVNCASQEYFGAVDLKALKLRVIEPVFLENKAGVEKVVSFFAKKARGAMARFAITERLDRPDGLKDFNTGGYVFQPTQSDGDRWVFSRLAEAAA
ncbi:MAG: peroxide stress protein YaaA [Pseudomonadota bacterium]